MRKSIALLLPLLLATPAFAQVTLSVTGTGGTVTIPACAAGQFFNGAAPPAGPCAAPPSGGMSGNSLVKTVTAPVSLVGVTSSGPGNDDQTFVFNSATPLSQPFPVSGSPGFTNGYSVLIGVKGAGCVTLTSTSPFYGGPVVFCKGDGALIEADDAGGWWIFRGVSPTLANPNAFQ